MLLALDSATSVVTVAVHDGAGGVHEEVGAEPMRHGEQLAPLIERALTAAGTSRTDLTGIAVGTGPGAFTGLRVGVVTARVMALALGIPAHGVCSLDVLALEARRLGVTGRLLTTIDARRRELFWAAYDEHGVRTTGPAVGSAVELRAGPAGDDVTVVGAGPMLHPDLLGEPHAPERPSAGWLARGVVEGVLAVEEPEPVYLRRPDATVPGPAKRVS